MRYIHGFFLFAHFISNTAHSLPQLLHLTHAHAQEPMRLLIGQLLSQLLTAYMQRGRCFFL